MSYQTWFYISNALIHKDWNSVVRGPYPLLKNPFKQLENTRYSFDSMKEHNKITSTAEILKPIPKRKTIAVICRSVMTNFVSLCCFS